MTRTDPTTAASDPADPPPLRAASTHQLTAALRACGAGNPMLTFPGADEPGRSAVAFGRSVGDLVEQIAGWLGVRERRVAASLVVLGYAARLLGPSVAVLLRDGLLLDVRPPRVRFAFAAGRGFSVGLEQPPHGWSGPPDLLTTRWRSDVLDDHLGMVVTAVRRHTRVAPALLWGNVASGLLGALATLARTGIVPATRCAGFAGAVLADGPLAGTGASRLAGGTLTFTRRSCCLYYRIPGGGYCGDCPLPLTRKAAP